MFIIVILLAIVYLSGVVESTRLYMMAWGPVCPECGARASHEAFWWPVRMYNKLGIDACDVCDTSKIDYLF
jgi:hypothetical protein